MNLLKASSLAAITVGSLLSAIACGGKVTYVAEGFGGTGGTGGSSVNSAQSVSTISSTTTVTNDVAVTNATVAIASSTGASGGTCGNIPPPVGTPTLFGGSGSGGMCYSAYQDSQMNVLGSSCSGSQCSCGWKSLSGATESCTCQSAGNTCTGVSCCPWVE